MSADVIALPRPKAARTPSNDLGFYVRVGRNDHIELLHLLASGERGIFGFVIEAQNLDRHRELIVDARRRGLDVILDPRTQQMAFPHCLSASLSSLPWGLDRHHGVADFDGPEGKRRAQQIVEFAATNGFTQILGPSHFLTGTNDQWLRRDILSMSSTADAIAASRFDLGLIYSLALPMKALRLSAERRALISAMADAPCNAIWMKAENFGDHSTGEKAAAYFEACRDFHGLGLPIVGDHVGGLPGRRRACFRSGRRNCARRNFATKFHYRALASSNSTASRGAQLASLRPAARHAYEATRR